MISISGTVSKGWLAGALRVRFDREYYFNPAQRYSIDSRCHDYVEEKLGDMGLFYSESNLGQFEYWGKDQVLVGGIQPNLILGMLLGAEFVPHDNNDSDITANCLAGKTAAELPEPETLLEHELIRLFYEQILQVQHDSERSICPVPPFYWDLSGRATIHGVMTSAQKFYGETFYMDMMTEPERCLEIMFWIAKAYVVLCRYFSETVKLPITAVHVGECSACMVGPDLIEQFVVPVTSLIGSELGPVRLHSCGPSSSHLEAFKQIENLNSLDLGGDTSIGKVRELFGKKMLISVSPMPHDMSAEGSETILRWARSINDENDGGPLAYVYHLEPDYNIDNLRALTDFVKSFNDFA